jgi:uncharacterized membrane protein YfcA
VWPLEYCRPDRRRGNLLLVSVLVLFGLPPISAIATSNLAIVVTASSGNHQLGQVRP